MKFRFIFTCMELATGYPFAVPLRSYTSEETEKAILSVIAILGAPIIILSDQGSNFLSITLTHLYKKFGISRIKTSAYHPQSNGKLERFHSTMKSMISKCISEKQDWPVALDLVLYFCRNMPHSRHGFTPHLARFTTILNGYMPKDNSTSITISEEFSTAFKNIISAVSHHSSLIVPTPADPLSIFSDASTSGVGGTLCVYRDLQWLPCSVYSRLLLPRERIMLFWIWRL